MRFKNSVFNSFVAVMAYIITYMFSFLNRTVFVRCLSADYLGVNSLFAEMISFLSLTELGIGTSIVYMMYKPLADGDIDQIRCLMNYYRKAYLFVGFGVSALAVIMIPFLNVIVKGVVIEESILFIYFLFVFSNASSYFLVYKKSILIADQKMGIASMIDAILKILQYSVQCIVLILNHDYIAYLMIQIFMQIADNIVITAYVNQKYPQYRKCYGKLGCNEKKEIQTNIGAMFWHRVGGKVAYSTDSIVMSACISTLAVGYYSNYQLIFSAGLAVVEKLFSGAIASIGDFSIQKSRKEARHLFELTNFIAFWIIGFMAVLIYLLIDDFISLCFGSEYILNKSIKTALCFYFYLNGMRRPALLFWEALGLFRYYKYKPLIESIINLSVSILLAEKIGLMGVVLGTICSIVLTSLWVDPLVVCKYGVDMSLGAYLKKYVQYLIVFLFTLSIAENILQVLQMTANLLSFIVKGFLGGMITILCFAVFFGKSLYMSEIKDRFIRK